MKYQPPFGVSDPNAPYINGNPKIALKGSIPPAASIEFPQREIVGVITKNRFVPGDDDLLQLTKSVRSQFINFADDTGAQNVLSVAFDPPIGAYTVGLPIRVRVHVSNDGPCTIDAGAGRVNIRRPSGAALAFGDLTAGGLVDLVYDGTAFQMINFLGTGGTGDISNFYVHIPYCVDTSPTANSIVAPFSPAITTLTAGDPILVKMANSNTGPTTIRVNALPAVNVFTVGQALLPYDLLAGQIYLFIYDGTQFHLQTPNNTIPAAVTFNIPSTQFNTPNALFDVLGRKSITQIGYVTVKLATGIFAPISVYHPDASRIAIKGTMIGARPTLSNFALSGASPAQRSADAAYNLAMLRGRYGTEVQVSATNGGFGIRIVLGSMPAIADLLVTCGNTSVNSTGIGDQPCSIDNVAVWGLRSGIYSDAVGTIMLSNCWASACFYGFSAIHGGTMGFNDFTGAGNGAVGCDEGGFYSSANGYMISGYCYARCNGHYGHLASQASQITGLYIDGLDNGYIDIAAFNMSGILVGNYVSRTMSPAYGTFGNNNSLILIQ